MKRYPWLFAVLVVVAVQRGAAATLTHDYPFDGAAVTDSVGTANGVLFNGAFVDDGVPVLRGQKSFVELGQQIVPTGGSPFSVSLFARETSAPSGQFVEMISQGLHGGPGFYLGHAPSGEIRVTDQLPTTGVTLPMTGSFIVTP